MIAQFRNTAYNTQGHQIWHPPQPVIVTSHLDKNSTNKIKATKVLADHTRIKNATKVKNNSKSNKDGTENLTKSKGNKMTIDSNKENQKDMGCPEIPTGLHG